MSKKIKKHEEKYYHIPKMNVFSLIGILVFGLLSYFNFELLNWDLFNLSVIEFYPFVFEYLFLSGFFISIIALIKGGFNQLKSIKEVGLIEGLISGFD